MSCLRFLKVLTAKKKIIYIVLDGLGDLALSELNQKTPLEAAFTPVLDRLAQQGVTGVVYPVEKGLAVESDLALFSLLGYDVSRYYSGGGPLEAAASGIDFRDGDVAVRVNFACAEADGKTIIDRTLSNTLSDEEAAGLAKEINQKVTLSSATFEFKNTHGYRGVLNIRGMHCRLSARVGNTDPAYSKKEAFCLVRDNFENKLNDCLPMEGFHDSPEAKETASLLNEFTLKSAQVLQQSAINRRRLQENQLPANLLLCRDAGDSLPKLPSLKQIFGMNFGSFVSLPAERLIAELSGMEIVEVPSPSGHFDVDYSVWAKIATDSLKKFEGLFIHLKGPDEPSHAGDFLQKKAIIEAIDKFFFADILFGLDMSNTVIAVCADHSTLCKTRSHSALPVPLLVYSSGIKPDGTLSFSEKTASLGSLGEMPGRNILPFLVKSAQN